MVAKRHFSASKRRKLCRRRSAAFCGGGGRQIVAAAKRSVLDSGRTRFLCGDAAGRRSWRVARVLVEGELAALGGSAGGRWGLRGRIGAAGRHAGAAGHTTDDGRWPAPLGDARAVLGAGEAVYNGEVH